MGVLSSLKKLLFATESVAKSAVNKAEEFADEKISGSDTTKADAPPVNDIGSKTSGLKESILEKAEQGLDKAMDLADSLMDKTVEAANDLGEKMEKGMDQLSQNENVKKALDFTEKVGEKVIDTSEEFVDKAKSFTEKVGAKVMEEGGELAEKAKTLSESIGEKVMAAKDEMVEKAKEAAHTLEEKFEELKEKAVRSEAEDAAKPKKDFADTDLTTGGSMLGGEKDDFFSKAEKFAEGKYDAFTDEKPAAESTAPKDVPSVDLPQDDGDTN